MRRVQFTLALVGMIISAYLSFEHATHNASLLCSNAGMVNCATVTSSSYSTAFGVPVAYAGLAFFVIYAALCARPAWFAALRTARYVGVTGALLSVLYLVWAEFFRINAICAWCTGVHLAVVALVCACVVEAVE